LRVTIPGAHIYHSYYKYYVFIRPEKLRPEWNRDRVLTELCARGVPCGTGVCPEIYFEEAFKNYGYRMEDGNHDVNNRRLPIAKKLGHTSLMFLVHPTLTEENMEYVIGQVKEVMSFATRD
jgi:dTDP-4-amino-4,6-dideoxygalactose transaminase